MKSQNESSAMKNKLGKSDILCACGCGQSIIITQYRLYRKTPKFIPGHNLKFIRYVPGSRIVSQETRQKLRSAIKRRMENGTYRSPFYKGMIGLKKGIPCPDNVKEKLRKNNLGKKHSDTTKEKLRIMAKEKGWGCWSKGRYLSEAHKAKISVALAGKMPENLTHPGKFNNVQRGWFNINGKEMFFRSKWEANYALYLDFLVRHKQIKQWEYEKDTFIFEHIKFGTRSYKPDFKVKNNDGTTEYHEIKGWLDPKSITKLTRMNKYYPQVKIRLVRGNELRKICQQTRGLIPFFHTHYRS